MFQGSITGIVSENEMTEKNIMQFATGIKQLEKEVSKFDCGICKSGVDIAIGPHAGSLSYIRFNVIPNSVKQEHGFQPSVRRG